MQTFFKHRIWQNLKILYKALSEINNRLMVCITWEELEKNMKGKSHHVSETILPTVQSQGDLHGLLSDSTQSSSMIASQLKSATQPKSSQNLSSSLKNQPLMKKIKGPS
ncbi:hypothetical protein EB796_013047 [Bugula neritina]|uniref:Uncharacterized protein n=1 Tax=Bugula neritina TaxID=10212 RepID=A0A7J7JSK4_BUGNE|nr:hypothetical protein EB796_013047 [Bugula neritina]